MAKYVSIIGYVVEKDTQEPIYDGGLWMVYESDDIDAAKADFSRVVEDLLPNYGSVDDLDYIIDVVQPLDNPPKIWKNRKVMKL